MVIPEIVMTNNLKFHYKLVRIKYQNDIFESIFKDRIVILSKSIQIRNKQVLYIDCSLICNVEIGIELELMILGIPMNI